MTGILFDRPFVGGIESFGKTGTPWTRYKDSTKVYGEQTTVGDGGEG